MQRLIDADVFKEMIGEDTNLRKNICRMIDDQPTAYDVEKVVECIHEYFVQKIDACEEDIIPHEILEYNKAICEIVRKGGVE